MHIKARTILLRVVTWTVSMFLLLGLVACSHQVLTFFFTGVPEPGQAEETLVEQLAESEKPGKNVRVTIDTDFAHGPFGAGACNLCHQSRVGSVFSQERSSTPVTNERQVSPRLAYPLAELCVGCHGDKQPSAAQSAGLWQHGPVANGLCTVCHNPHKAPRQYMLLADNSTVLCGQCHSKNDLRHTRDHNQAETNECSDCHNPHVGKSRFLLRAEHDERRWGDEA